MVTGKLNLTALKHVIMEKKGKTGIVKGIFIPIDANNLYISEKTNSVYLDLVAFDMKKPFDNQTHIIKQSFSKTVRESMTKEQMNELPILGGLNIVEYKPAETVNDLGNGQTFTENDDLPF